MISPLVTLLLGITRAKPCEVLYPSPGLLHSLVPVKGGRGGGASAAANSGVPDRVFQRHGCWKSATAMDGYVEDSTDVKLSVSKSLGL